MWAALAAVATSVPAALAGQAAAPLPRDYTGADVHFVQGMILHHAQAVVMSDWAASHGARADVALLCRRIALSQRDEITMMQHWLQARGLSAPDPLHMLPGDTGTVKDGSGMAMPGMDMGSQALMPGMLTPARMHALDAARGTAFDTLYLTSMIRHHEGALAMVATLFAAPGSGQQPELFTFATDVDAGQRAEIARMQALLSTFTPSHDR